MPENPVKYRGVAFEFGDRVLIVPPLSSAQLELHADALDKMYSANPYTMKTVGKFLGGVVAPIVQSALSRNYPEISLVEVKEFVTTENWVDLASSLLGNNKANKVRVGEPFPAVLPGSEALISSPTSTGVGSGLELPAEPVGVGSTS